MISSVRIFSALFFALVLTLTAQNLAQARGQTTVAGQMVLCTGTGVVTVQFDAEGNPIKPSHICPECALSFLMTVDAAPTAVSPLRYRAKVDFLAVTVSASGGVVLRAKARGPPFSHRLTIA